MGLSMRFFGFGKKASPVASLQINGLPAANWTAHNYSRWSADFYARNVIAFRCISAIAASAASVPLYATDSRGNEVPAFAGMKLLSDPNKGQSQSDFIEQLVTYWLISGNAYAVRDEGSSKPLELWTLCPANMSIYSGESGLPAYYKYRSAGGEKNFPVDQVSGACDVFHWRRPSIDGGQYGLSPMFSAGYSIDIHNEVSRWNKSTLQNNAKPSGALQIDGNLTDEQMNRVKSMVDDQWSGSNNAGRPMLLEGGMKWQQMSMSPAELDYIKNKQDVAREICQAFGFPPLLLGLAGDNTYANYSEARLALWEDTVLPVLDKFLDAINRWFVQFYGYGVKIAYDRDSVPALENRRYEAFERLQKASFLTINEKRAMVGFEPIDGGDNVMVPASELPLTMALESDTGAAIKSLMDAGMKAEDALAAVKASHEIR